MPSTWLIVLLVVVWVAVLTPMLINSRAPIRRTSKALEETRILHRGSDGRVSPSRRIRPRVGENLSGIEAEAGEADGATSDATSTVAKADAVVGAKSVVEDGAVMETGTVVETDSGVEPDADDASLPQALDDDNLPVDNDYSTDEQSDVEYQSTRTNRASRRLSRKADTPSIKERLAGIFGFRNRTTMALKGADLVEGSLESTDDSKTVSDVGVISDLIDERDVAEDFEDTLEDIKDSSEPVKEGDTITDGESEKRVVDDASSDEDPLVGQDTSIHIAEDDSVAIDTLECDEALAYGAEGTYDSSVTDSDDLLVGGTDETIEDSVPGEDAQIYREEFLDESYADDESSPADSRFPDDEHLNADEQLYVDDEFEELDEEHLVSQDIPSVKKKSLRNWILGQREEDRVHLDEADLAFAARRRGRGGYDPEADYSSAVSRCARRRRILIGFVVTLSICLVAGIIFGNIAWYVTGGVSVAFVLYLLGLRSQVRLEIELSQRRRRKIQRARMGVELSEDSELHIVPTRLRRPGAMLLETDDGDPSFDHLNARRFAEEFDGDADQWSREEGHIRLPLDRYGRVRAHASRYPDNSYQFEGESDVSNEAEVEWDEFDDVYASQGSSPRGGTYADRRYTDARYDDDRYFGELAHRGADYRGADSQYASSAYDQSPYDRASYDREPYGESQNSESPYGEDPYSNHEYSDHGYRSGYREPRVLGDAHSETDYPPYVEEESFDPIQGQPHRQSRPSRGRGRGGRPNRSTGYRSA